MSIRFKTLLEWFKQCCERSRQANEAKRNTLLEAEAYNVLQVREFDGKLFVCYRDVPVIEQAQLDCPIEAAVRTARAVYREYFKYKQL